MGHVEATEAWLRGKPAPRSVQRQQNQIDNGPVKMQVNAPQPADGAIQAPGQGKGVQQLGAAAPVEDYEAQAKKSSLEARMMAMMQGWNDEIQRMRTAFDATTKTVHWDLQHNIQTNDTEGEVLSPTPAPDPLILTFETPTNTQDCEAQENARNLETALRLLASMHPR